MSEYFRENTPDEVFKPLKPTVQTGETPPVVKPPLRPTTPLRPSQPIPNPITPTVKPNYGTENPCGDPNCKGCKPNGPNNPCNDRNCQQCRPQSSPDVTKRHLLAIFGGLVGFGLLANCVDSNNRAPEAKPAPPKPTIAPAPTRIPSPTPFRPSAAAKPAESRVPTATPKLVSFDLPNPSQIRKPGTTPYDIARRIMGDDFLGHDALNRIFEVGRQSSDLPPIPFDQEELERARQLDQFLIYREQRLPIGKPLNEDVLNDILERNKIQPRIVWNGGPKYLDGVSPDQKWSLVGKEVLPSSKMASYDHRSQDFMKAITGQTEALANYLMNQVYNGQSIPEPLYNAVHQYAQSKRPSHILENWQNVYNLKINTSLRHKSIELLYDLVSYEVYRGIKLLGGQAGFTMVDSRVYKEGGFTIVGRAAPPKPQIIQFMNSTYTNGPTVLEPIGVVFSR